MIRGSQEVEMNDRDEESDPMLGKIPNEINEGEAAANILY